MALSDQEPKFNLLEGYTTVAHYDFIAQSGTYTDGVDEFTIENPQQTLRNAATLFGMGIAGYRGFHMPVDEPWIIVGEYVVDGFTATLTSSDAYTIGSNRNYVWVTWLETSPNAGTFYPRIRARDFDAPTNEQASETIVNHQFQVGQSAFFKTKYDPVTRGYTYSFHDATGTEVASLSSNNPHGTSMLGDGKLPFDPQDDPWTHYRDLSVTASLVTGGGFWIGRDIPKTQLTERAGAVKLVGRRNTGKKSGSRPRSKPTTPTLFRIDGTPIIRREKV